MSVLGKYNKIVESLLKSDTNDNEEQVSEAKQKKKKKVQMILSSFLGEGWEDGTLDLFENMTANGKSIDEACKKKLVEKKDEEVEMDDEDDEFEIDETKYKFKK